jgi:hypothetical protein
MFRWRYDGTKRNNIDSVINTLQLLVFHRITHRQHTDKTFVVPNVASLLLELKRELGL